MQGSMLTLMLMYQRPCFVCDQVGVCGHRERLVELAHITSMNRELEKMDVANVTPFLNIRPTRPSYAYLAPSVIDVTAPDYSGDWI